MTNFKAVTHFEFIIDCVKAYPEYLSLKKERPFIKVDPHIKYGILICDHFTDPVFTISCSRLFMRKKMKNKNKNWCDAILAMRPL